MFENEMKLITVEVLKKKPLFKNISLEWLAGLVEKYHPEIELNILAGVKEPQLE